MTLGWLAISGKGASTTFEVGSGAFAAGGWGAVADGELVAVAGATLRRPELSWAWAVKTPKHMTPKRIELKRISLRMK
jgi:hypothetical protein